MVITMKQLTRMKKQGSDYPRSCGLCSYCLIRIAATVYQIQRFAQVTAITICQEENLNFYERYGIMSKIKSSEPMPERNPEELAYINPDYASQECELCSKCVHYPGCKEKGTVVMHHDALCMYSVCSSPVCCRDFELSF